MFFHVSPDTRPWKTTKSSKFLGFWKILGKNRPIFVKNGSRNFKSRYLRNTFLLSTFALIELWSWNLAKLENKWVQKNCITRIFDFQPHFEKNGLCMLQIRIWSIHNPFFSKWGWKSKIRVIQFFCTHLFSNLAKFQLHSSIRAKVDSKNVFLRYRDLKFRDPFFTKIGLFLPNIFQNPKNLLDFVVFHGLVSGDTWKNITKHV